MLDIYQIAPASLPWDIQRMAAKAGKKQESERRARVLYHRLLEAKPADLTERQWTLNAGVNVSFFTNLKKGSEPSIGNLRLVLEAIGLTLPEFFAHEAAGKLLPAPSERALAEALERVLPGLPQGLDRQAEYLATTVLDVLGLPPTLRANAASDSMRDQDAPSGAAPTRAATK